ncbi:MAG: SRPBCC family protein [Actinomycetota bacterium]|nr:SRPBCC family protein [Actinomycetota bacterium]
MDHAEVSHTITATPERLYALISDMPRMGEWSQENNGGKWLKGATGPAVGAKFKGKNSKGFRRWSTIATVVTADAGKEFAFDVTVKGMKVARWGFRLEAAEGGTKVTEFWDDHRVKVMKVLTGLALGIPDRVSHNTAGMEHTLTKLAAAV